jgi:hypothetical protein
MLILKFDSKHRIGKRFQHHGHDFYGIFLRHNPSLMTFKPGLAFLRILLTGAASCEVTVQGRVNTHGPLLVTATVCSK